RQPHLVRHAAPDLQHLVVLEIADLLGERLRQLELVVLRLRRRLRPAGHLLEELVDRLAVAGAAQVLRQAFRNIGLRRSLAAGALVAALTSAAILKDLVRGAGQAACTTALTAIGTAALTATGTAASTTAASAS